MRVSLLLRTAAPVFTLITAVLCVLAFAVPARAYDNVALARRAYEKLILPEYARFAEMARTFAERTEALCRAPSTAALADARAASKAALLAWGRIEPIRFGPIAARQRLERLLFFPDPHHVADRQIARLLSAKNDDAITEERLAGASVAVQGFGAVDVVLYGPGSDALANTDPASSFRCRYVAALAAGIADIAADVQSEWSGAYARTWLKPGGDNTAYLSPEETTQALYRAYVTELDVLRLHRLAPMLGADGKTSRSPPLLRHSGLALRFILAGIDGARNMLGENGFLADDPSANEKQQAARAILESAATDLGFATRAGEAAEALSAGGEESDENLRGKLIAMGAALDNVDAVSRPTLGELTGQTLGFNSLDGD